MNCDQSHDYMMKYLDGKLNDSEHAELIHHINKCGQCCTEFQEYSKIVKALEEDKGIEPPENFEFAVMSKIRLIDNRAKIEREKRILILGFLSGIVLMLGLIVSSVFLKEYILELMKYAGIPTGITYAVYGILSNISDKVKVFIRLAYCFNSIFSDIYYVFMGLFVIAGLSKIYKIKELENKSSKSVNVLQNE